MLDALFPWARQAVLALLFSLPDEAFYQRQIVRATRGGKGAVQRELEALTKAGIIVRETRGNRVYYRANRDCPIYPELSALMVKTAGVADVVRDALSQVEGVRLAFIFGSTARGGTDAKSDVDVLIVTDTPHADISGALLSAQQRLGREISATVYSRAEFEEKLEQKHDFLTQVLQEPRIALIGNPDDLA
jgi:predicted nucleotidyltransferase